MNRNEVLTVVVSLVLGFMLAATSGCMPEVPPLVSSHPSAEVSGLQDFYLGTVTGSYMPPNDVPQNPYLAIGRNGIHETTWNDDVTEHAGPVSSSGAMSVTTHKLGLFPTACPTLLFDSQNRVITNCITFGKTTLYLLDPTTLKVLAQVALPPKENVGLDGKSDAAGGGYVHLDAAGQVLLGPYDRTIRTYEIVEDAGTFSLQLVRSFDLSPIVPVDAEPGDYRITDTLIDYQGRYWFTTNSGVIGYVVDIDDPQSEIRTYDFGENMQNQVAVDESGVYVVTWTHMRKVAVAETDDDPNCSSACLAGDIYEAWVQEYDTSAADENPNLVSPGSGTSPTLFGEYDDIVAIADNAAPTLHLNLYDRTTGTLICSHPTFADGGAENSPSAHGDEIVLSNNAGYGGIWGDPQTLQPGLIKVRVNSSRTGCTTEWERYDFKGTATPFLSTENGTIYTYAVKQGTDGADAWYLTAVDWITGQIVYQKYVGSGGQFDNIVMPVTVSPDHGAYISVKNGIALVRDL
jgi:hypothetical protein